MRPQIEEMFRRPNVLEPQYIYSHLYIFPIFFKLHMLHFHSKVKKIYLIS